MAQLTLRGGPLNGQRREAPLTQETYDYTEAGQVTGRYNRKNMMGIASKLEAYWEPIDADR